MSQINTYWRIDRPESGFYTTELPAPTGGLHLRTFLPDGYEPGYAYPLLVLFHPHGSNEEQVLRLVPRVSRRNFIAISFRGPERLGQRANGSPACGWGNLDTLDTVTESVLRAVEQTRRMYHVHSERVYFVGVNDGADGAYRAAFALADKIAGVVSLNGALPRVEGNPLFDARMVRNLRVMIGHGIANTRISLGSAQRDQRLFYAVGADVTSNTYPTTHRITPAMLADLNRWVIGHVNAEHDMFVRTGV